VCSGLHDYDPDYAVARDHHDLWQDEWYEAPPHHPEEGDEAGKVAQAAQEAPKRCVGGRLGWWVGGQASAVPCACVAQGELSRMV